MAYVRNSAGLDEVLHLPQLKATMHALAEQVADDTAAAVEAHDPNGLVVVDDYVTDRVASSVTVASPIGRFLQAAHGVLTVGAGKNGLIIRQKGSQ